MIEQVLAHVSNDTLHEIAQSYETPTYVYDANLISEKFKAYQEAFSGRKHQICYAVKANSNIAILKYLADLGSGFDIVSIGELKRVLMAGGKAEKTIFSGVGKSIEEIAFALEAGIEVFDVESLQELDSIIAVAEAMKTIASISIRFNPNIDAKTHPYIATGLKDNKFGLTKAKAFEAYKKAKDSKHIKIVGINMHIGSQIKDLSVFEEALNIQSEFVYQLEKTLDIKLDHINVGGGIGVKYKDEKTINLKEWASLLKTIYPNNDVTLITEPGRSIVANAGVLLTETLYTKEQSGNHFAIVDAAMNDYMRTALYQAHNHISNLSREPQKNISQAIVGPVCESSDCFAQSRNLDILAGDLLAIHDTGAYGFSMASNYNSRVRAAEVLAEGDDYRLIRRRETFEELIDAELIGGFELEEE